MYEPYIAVAALTSALILLGCGLAIFHFEANKGRGVNIEQLVVGLLLVVAGFTLMVVPSMVVRRARFEAYDPAEFLMPFGLIILWIIIAVGSLVVIVDGIGLLYEGLTPEERKLQGEAADVH